MKMEKKIILFEVKVFPRCCWWWKSSYILLVGSSGANVLAITLNCVTSEDDTQSVYCTSIMYCTGQTNYH